MLRDLCTSLSSQSDKAVEKAIPGFADAVMSGLLRRFWCKEVIGEADKARLRAALNDMSRIDPLESSSLPPTMRRILIDERDVVLAEALKTAPGECVVGVVGKAHIPGIVQQWHEDTAAKLPATLEEPPPSLAPLAGLVAAGVGLPMAAYRSRPVRLALAATGLVSLGGAAWLATAIRDRVDFYQKSQRELVLHEHTR